MIKAHAIPAAFFDSRDTDDTSSMKLISNADGMFPKRSPIGVYDEGILCQECENRFSDFDTYGATVLLKTQSAFSPIPPRGRPEAFICETYNYGLLKLFFMSILWRASASSHDFYRRVKLGAREAELLSLIKAQDASAADKFGVILRMYDNHPVASAVMDPYRARIDAITIYRFRLNRYHFWINADKRPFPKDVRDLQLAPGKPLTILYDRYEGSQDHGVATAIARGQKVVRRLTAY